MTDNIELPPQRLLADFGVHKRAFGYTAEDVRAAILADRARQAPAPVEVSRLGDLLDHLENVCRNDGFDHVGNDGVVDKYDHVQRARDAVDAALASMASTPVGEVPAGLSVAQEPKYTVNGSAIVNRASGEAIPADEPVFIFRARDKHAIKVLGFYADKFCRGEHYAAVRKRMKHFRQFQSRHPERMKEPDTAASPAPAASKGAEAVAILSASAFDDGEGPSFEDGPTEDGFAAETPYNRLPKRVVFPTMLRKMWSGGEVQRWLDEHVNGGSRG